MPSISVPSNSELAPPLIISAQATNSVPVLVDFLNSVPASLTTVLVGLAPYINLIRNAGEVISWRTSVYDSWLAVFAWWAGCLFAEAGLRYFLPVAILIILAFRQYTLESRFAPPPITETNLQTVIVDLDTIHKLLPTHPSIPKKSSGVILRVFATLYVPYLILTYFVKLRILLGIAGTIILTWRAPWASRLRENLWRSAWVRWSLYNLWAKLSGEEPPSTILSKEPKATTPKPVNSIRFLFTIYENQRWWVGLDWTAALLPGERPSWCSAAQHPVSPPNAFSLPSDTTVYIGDGKGGRIRRTAKWTWEEAEWKVCIRKYGGSGLIRVEKPLPSGKEESTASSKLAKAAGAIKRVSVSTGSNSGPGGSIEGGLPADAESEASAEDPFTDTDGWVFGDNKWEGTSGKGGMGKYTRYRRWTRIAILSETVEVIESGSTGISRSTNAGLNHLHINPHTKPRTSIDSSRTSFEPFTIPSSPGGSAFASSSTMSTGMLAATQRTSGVSSSPTDLAATASEGESSGVLADLSDREAPGKPNAEPEENRDSNDSGALRQRLKSAIKKGTLAVVHVGRD